MTDETAAWGGRVRARLVTLTLARVGARQSLAFAWFLVAARELPQYQFGLLAAGLIWSNVLGLLGSLGIPLTINRHVAAAPETARSAMRVGALLRLAGAAVVGLAAVGVAIATDAIPVQIVALAAAIAAASGLSDVAYATLRALGRLRVETVTLVTERLLFLLVAGYLAWRGTTATVILVVYLVTNVVTATAGCLVAIRSSPRSTRPAPTFRDAEAVRAGATWTALGLVPQISSVLLVLFATAAAVGTYAIAANPVEGVATFAIASSVPLLAPLRAHAVAGRSDALDLGVIAVSLALLAAIGPLVVWFIVSPTAVTTLIAGADRYPDSATVLRIMAAVALLWPVRSIIELTLVARERSAPVLRTLLIGATVNIAIGIPLVHRSGARGAAYAVLIANVVMLALILVQSPGVFRHARVRAAVVPIAVLLGAAITTFMTRDLTPLASLVCIAPWLVIGMAVGYRKLAGLDRVEDLERA